MTACPICGSKAFEAFGRFAFGGWREEGERLERERFVYRLVECRACQHVMARHDHGPDFVERLYALPQTRERWALEDLPADAPYAEMVAFSGPAGLPDSRPPDSGLVVDVGCGDGILLRTLRDRFGVPMERLMGVDFADHVGDGFRVAATNLDRLGADDAPRPFDGFAMAYCSHVLEHLTDPRGFLAALRRRAGDGARLYLEVPDAGNAELWAAELANIHNAQHLHYFTLPALRLLAESCGWSVEKADAGLFGFTPRARLLLKAERQGAARAATEAILAHLDALWRRAAAAILEAGQGEEGQGAVGEGGAPVGLWGVGGDLIRMLDAAPELDRRLTAGGFRLFDRAWAGRSFRGAAVEDPVALAGLLAGGGVVFLTPRPAKTRVSMTAAAAGLGLDPARLRSPYGEEPAPGPVLAKR